MMALDDKVGVIVLTNGDDSRPDRIAAHAMEWIGEPLAKTAAPKPKPRWDPAWRRFVGLYRSRHGDTQVLEMNESLVMINPEADDPRTAMMKLIPASGDAFRLDAPTGASAVGEPVTFQEERGTVTGMTVGQQPLARVR
jgi:D-alanyl-D-alanine carboxypeptidase